jgi:signal transduction histidine kinase
MPDYERENRAFGEVAREVAEHPSNRKRVDLRTIPTETIEARRPQIERRRQELSIDIGHEPVWIDGDPVRLAQVLSNLLDNAAKYTPEKGRISVAVTTEAAGVTVDVRDTGMGIEPDEMTRIFEPMTQLLESRAWSAGGLGLGLSLVRGITELHGGTVRVKSTGAGRGSCFSVRLPVQAAATA